MVVWVWLLITETPKAVCYSAKPTFKKLYNQGINLPLMPDHRSRGKSVVLDSLPSVVTTRPPSSSSKKHTRSSKFFNKEAFLEVLFVLFGLIFVVWVFFGGSKPNQVTNWTTGGRKVVTSYNPLIVPLHYMGASGGRDSVKKAPGDKKSTSLSDSNQLNEKSQSILHRYAGHDSPKIVLLTVIEDKLPREFTDRLIENRVEYGETHNYGVFIKYQSDFLAYVDESDPRSDSWAKVALCSEAQYTFPGAEWFWYLDSNAYIMNSELDIGQQLLTPAKLKANFLGGVSVMKNFNSHIQTLRNPNIKQSVFLSSLDFSKKVHDRSFFFKNSFTGQAFVQSWGELLYKTCTRITDSAIGLRHLLQWHYQYLSRALIIPNTFTGKFVDPEVVTDEEVGQFRYTKGDFVAIFDCDYNTEPCKRKLQTIWNDRVKSTTAKKGNAPKVAKDSVQNQVQVEAQEKAQEKAEKLKPQ